MGIPMIKYRDISKTARAFSRSADEVQHTSGGGGGLICAAPPASFCH